MSRVCCEGNCISENDSTGVVGRQMGDLCDECEGAICKMVGKGETEVDPAALPSAGSQNKIGEV